MDPDLRGRTPVDSPDIRHETTDQMLAGLGPTPQWPRVPRTAGVDAGQLVGATTDLGPGRTVTIATRRQRGTGHTRLQAT